MADEIKFDHDVLDAELAGAREELQGLITRTADNVASGTGIDADTIDALRGAIEATTSQMRGAGDDADVGLSASREARSIAQDIASALDKVVAEESPQTGLSSGAAPSQLGGGFGGGQGVAASQASQAVQAVAAQQQAVQQQMAQAQQMQQAQMAAARQQTMQAQAAQQQAQLQQMQQQSMMQQSILNALAGQTAGTSDANALSDLGGDSTVDKKALREESGEGDYVSGENYDGHGVFTEESEGRAIELAQEYASAGIPYVWGGGHGAEPGQTGGGLDCSGLARDFMWQWKGIDINGTSETMYNMGTEIHPDDARPGDLWFPDDSGVPPGHVGVYIGNGQVLEAQTTGTEVGIFEARPGSYRRVE